MESNLMSTRLRYRLGIALASGLFAVSLILFLTVALPGLNRASDLEHDSKTAVAEVLTADTMSKLGVHNTNYSFIVNGKRYFGNTVLTGNRDFVDVHYLRSDPSYSATDPAENGKRVREQAFLFITGVTFLGATALILWRESRRPAKT